MCFSSINEEGEDDDSSNELLGSNEDTSLVGVSEVISGLEVEVIDDDSPHEAKVIKTVKVKIL